MSRPDAPETRRPFRLLRQSLRGLARLAPEVWFLAVALGGGLVFLVFVPAHQVPDEPAHLTKAWLLSNGQVLPTPDVDEGEGGGQVPLSLLALGPSRGQPYGMDAFREDLGRPLDARDTVVSTTKGPTPYSPTLYVPQALGLGIGHALSLPALATFWLGRLANLAAYCAIGVLAIRVAPYGKWVLVLAALLPMHLQLAASYSADAQTAALIALAVAVVLRLRLRAKTGGPVLDRRETLLLGLLAVAIALVKPPFPLVLALGLLVPTRVLAEGPRALVRRLALWLVPAAVVGAAWLALGLSVTGAFTPEHAQPDAEDQLRFVAAHPFAFLAALAKTYVSGSFLAVLRHAVYSVGWLNATLPDLATLAYVAAFALATFPLRDPNADLGGRAKLWVGVLAAAFAVLVPLLLYLTWNDVGAGGPIQGVQARYLTILLPLLVPLAVQAGPAASGVLPGAGRWLPPAGLGLAFVALLAYFW